MSLTRDEIKEKSDNFPVHRVETPAWGGDGFVFVRMFRANEAHEIGEIAKEINADTSNEKDALVHWAIFGVCDEKGDRLFTKDDAEWLGEGPFSPLKDCVTRVMELNNITASAEELEKNSETSRKSD